jgi:hypothetical protein
MSKYSTTPSHSYGEPLNVTLEPKKYGTCPLWQRRSFPKDNLSILPYDKDFDTSSFQSSPVSSRVDFSAFINSMDDASFAYMSLLREYASRTLQSRAVEYGGLYKAMVFQQAEDEKMSRISVVEYESSGLRSRTFASYDDFKTYLDTTSTNESLKRLIILEDLPVRFVCLLGSRLRIHPTIFARQYSMEDSASISANIVALPSIVQTSTRDGLDYVSDDESLHDPFKKRSFTLQYPVIMPRVSAKQHPNPQKCPLWFKPSARLRGQSAYPRFMVERVLHTPSRHDQWDTRGEISELDSQATYWYQKLSAGGWNGTILYTCVFAVRLC